MPLLYSLSAIRVMQRASEAKFQILQKSNLFHLEAGSLFTKISPILLTFEHGLKSSSFFTFFSVFLLTDSIISLSFELR